MSYEHCLNGQPLGNQAFQRKRPHQNENHIFGITIYDFESNRLQIYSLTEKGCNQFKNLYTSIKLRTSPGHSNARDSICNSRNKTARHILVFAQEKLLKNCPSQLKKAKAGFKVLAKCQCNLCIISTCMHHYQKA